jgi:hypothetical protein
MISDKALTTPMKFTSIKVRTFSTEKLSTEMGICVPAFRTTKFGKPISFSISAIVLTVASKSETSRGYLLICLFANSFCKLIKSFSVLALTATVHEFSANIFANSLPIPLPAPVTQTVLTILVTPQI